MSIAVLGAGAFGTALAIAFASDGTPVTLWARDAGHAADMDAARENAGRLQGHDFPDTVRVTSGLADVAQAGVLILAVPAQQTGPFLAMHAAQMPEAPLILAAKGIDSAQMQTQSAVALGHKTGPLAVLSGPGFAAEIAAGLPTALTLAAVDDGLARTLQDSLSRPSLRLYRTGDVTGVELGGALKNVVALAAGIAIGAGLGESARAALMTRGYAEMVRLGVAMGAEPATFAGLSGLGDLALTCGTPQSRNFAAGIALGKQGHIAEGQTVEGVATARAAVGLAVRHGVEMPIAKAVSDVLEGQSTIHDAMQALLSRSLKAEG